MSAELLVLSRSPDVIVYTMGKVASTSISRSLIAAGLSIFDVHFLNLERALSVLATEARNPDRPLIPDHLIESILAQNTLRTRRAAGGRTKIVSLIREPVARNISAVFQNLPKRLHNNVDAIVERLRGYSLNIPDTWFLHDFIPVTGLDVFAMEHDRSSDHFRLTNELFDVLIIKVDTSDARKSLLLSEFLARPIEIKRANIGANKWYAEIYRTFTQNPSSIRDAYISECMKARYFQAFFSESEHRAIAESLGHKLGN